MAPVREVVLDAETGLPEVRASLSQDGSMIFRVHTIHPGGMSVFVPINDALLRRVRDVFDASEDEHTHAEHIAAVQRQYAASLKSADAERQQRLIDVEAENEALTKVLEEERATSNQEIARLQEELAEARSAGSGEAAKAPRRGGNKAGAAASA